jgi:hypothetical protein
MIDRLRRLPDPAVIALTTLSLALPLIVAVIALAQRRWIPVLDLAMTEFRVTDVGTRQTPLTGLPGRIGVLPNQGTHPGPLSFWALAPVYRIFGSSAWALEVATVSMALVWIALALLIGHRRLGRVGLAIVAAVIAVLLRGYGMSVLTQPWNPYLPLLAWLVVLLATWAVLCGDDAMLVPLVVAASYCAQTHIPYLTMAGSLGVVAIGVVIVRWWRARSETRVPRSLLITLCAFGVLWVGPALDQVVRDPGNISRLLDHFGSPPEEVIGYPAGFRLMLRHLDAVGGFARLISGNERFLQSGFDPDGPIWPGIVVLAVWVGASVVAIRLRHLQLIALHVTLGVALLATVASTSRIFGPRWFYLTLWAWVTTTLIFVAIAWTAVAWTRAHGHLVSTRTLTIGAGALAVVTTFSMVVLAPSTKHPEEYLGDTIGELLPATEAALDPDRSYVVEWKDAYFFGSQAFALVSELRRDGFDVGASTYWRVPMTNERTKENGAAEQAVVMVTGEFIDDWDADDRYTRVALVDPRDPAQRDEYARLRTELIAELKSSGLDDLLDLVDTNLFGLNIDQRVSDRAQELSARMVSLGQATAIFLGPPGAKI